MNEPKVIVIGNSYSSFSFFYFLAKKVTNARKAFDILLISRNKYFFFNDLLYEFLSNSADVSDIAQDIRDLGIIKPGISYLEADILNVDFSSRLIKTSKGNIIYEYLVLAPDYDYEYSKKVLELNNNNCFQIKTPHDVIRLKKHIHKNLDLASLNDLSINDKKSYLSFVVVGNVTQAIETASSLYDFVGNSITKRYPELKKSYLSVIIVTESKDLSDNKNTFYKNKLFYNLNKRGISILFDSYVTYPDKEKVCINNNKIINTHTIIFCSEIETPSLIRNLPFVKSKSFLASVDLYLKAEGHKNVFVIGNFSKCLDLVSSINLNVIDFKNQARICANNVISEINNISPCPAKSPVDINFVGLGYRSSLLYIKNFCYDGFLPWIFRRLIFIFSFLGFKKKLQAFVSLFINLLGLDKPELLDLYLDTNKEKEKVTNKT